MSKAGRVALAALPLAAAGVALARRRPPPSPVPYHGADHRVLVLGGGFGGFTAAARIAAQAPPGTSVLVVDRHDYLTFWPMVPEVIPASIEVQHALRPLAGELTRAGARFLCAEVREVDLDRKVVSTNAGDLGYDELVVALGWQTNYFGTRGAAEHGVAMDGIEDAVRVRDRVIGQLQRASAAAVSGHTPAPADLGVVVVGGGSTGVEVAANVRELLDTLAPQYPALSADALRVHLLQAADDVLPHVDTGLRHIAAARLRTRQIDVRTDARAHEVDAAGVVLSDGTRIEAATVVWAAGVEPNPVAGRVKGAAPDRKGRLVVDEHLRLEGRRGVYALGDIAAVDSGGRPVPPTAQAAVQEAACVAANLLAELRGGSPRGFTYRFKGQLVDLGSRFAVSEVMGRRASGTLAQILWRSVYLFKLGDTRDRARVVSDWVLDAVLGPRVSRLPLAGG